MALYQHDADGSVTMYHLCRNAGCHAMVSQEFHLLINTTDCGFCPGPPLAAKFLLGAGVRGVRSILTDQRSHDMGFSFGCNLRVANRRHNSRAPILHYVSAATCPCPGIWNMKESLPPRGLIVSQNISDIPILAPILKMLFLNVITRASQSECASVVLYCTANR